jgi:F-type H+-transporting ATPase subunit b
VLIDWFTVIAQIINFLILVALLKYFLYGRIIKAMDEREGKIRSRLEEASRKEEEAEQEAKSLRQKHQEIEEKRERMLSRAREEADVRRKELVQQARSEVENLQGKWREAIRRERESFIRDLQRMAGREVYAIAQRALEDLADVEVEERAIGVFLERARNLKAEERNEIVQSIEKAGSDVVVRSSFELSTKMRREVTKTLHEHIAEGFEVNYETAPELIMGIELKAPGAKIAWTLEDYMATLEESAREALEAQAPSEGEGKTTISEGG